MRFPRWWWSTEYPCMAMLVGTFVATRVGMREAMAMPCSIPRRRLHTLSCLYAQPVNHIDANGFLDWAGPSCA
eukprot:366562-Chlamydomonas_euryale.AAC.7